MFWNGNLSHISRIGIYPHLIYNLIRFEHGKEQNEGTGGHHRNAITICLFSNFPPRKNNGRKPGNVKRRNRNKGQGRRRRRRKKIRTHGRRRRCLKGFFFSLTHHVISYHACMHRPIHVFRRERKKERNKAERRKEKKGRKKKKGDDDGDERRRRYLL